MDERLFEYSFVIRICIKILTRFRFGKQNFELGESMCRARKGHSGDDDDDDDGDKGRAQKAARHGQFVKPNCWSRPVDLPHRVCGIRNCGDAA